jgi:hypothetical protein
MYYNCCNRNCSQKSKSIKADKLHEEVRLDMLERHCDESINNLFDYIFNEVIESNITLIKNKFKEKEKDLKEIEIEIKKTMEKIMTLDNQDVLKRLDSKVSELE